MKKGISLIVLSITILVMAILAATVIIALEDSGIIGRSKNTVKNNNHADEYTRLVVIKNGILTDNLGTITLDEYITELQNKGIIDSTIIENADGSKTFTTSAGVEVTVAQNGNSDLDIEIKEAASTNQPGNTIMKIIFYIDSNEYEAEDGMTWEEWINSEYNPGQYYVYNGLVRNGVQISVRYSTEEFDFGVVLASHTIIEGYVYGD